MAVYLSPLGGAGWQFLDNNGNPLAGGLLYTYAAGTTTPQATYTTAAGNVANANPIVLDSAGRVANQVWLTAGVSYKLEKDPLVMLETLKMTVAKARSEEESTMLQQILDDTTELISSTLYKIKFLA